MNTETFFEPRLLLQQELAKRCQRNPRYSLRAFAASLGLSHTVLSLVLSGKRPLSKRACEQVAKQLALSPTETELLRRCRTGRAPVVEPSAIIDLDLFAVISDWYHFAILNYLNLPDGEPDARKIARRLRITGAEARLAIERLKRLGLMVEENGRWRPAQPHLKIDDRDTNAATRKFQAQILQKAIESLENDPRELRDHTSVNFAMKRSSLPYARRRIAEFRRELMAELEQMGIPDAVYTISLQLFPLSTEDK